jgi:hypothetical protein
MSIKKLDIHPNLHGYIGTVGASLPGDLVGATIVQIGCAWKLENGRDLENGFVIDYIPVGEKKTQRLVICSTELGMWIEGQCTL